MLKILQAHPLRAFVAILKIDAIYALYPESFCDKNLAVRKVFAFSDSAIIQEPIILYESELITFHSGTLCLCWSTCWEELAVSHSAC